MENLYNAVVAKQKTFTWPSRKVVDISSLTLFSLTDLRKPVFKTDQKERENADWREEVMPYLKYEYPREQATTVDVIMNEIKIQDKPGQCCEGKQGCVANLQKSSGRQTDKVQPYQAGDFEALFVFGPYKKNFWIIPAAKLTEHKILSTSEQKGSTSVTCYKSDYTRPVKNAWTSKYCFDVKDPELKIKVQDLLNSCKS